jgi:hypothetical protein
LSLQLFGDTFIGLSSRSRRLPESFFIHNSVGLLTPSPPSSPPSPSSLTFHWNLSSSGCPISLFLPQLLDDECTLNGTYYWPVSGLGVSLPNGSAYLLISAIHWAYMNPPPTMTPIEADEEDDSYNTTDSTPPKAPASSSTAPPPTNDLLTNDTFNFNVLGTTLIVVSNPHDEPRHWRYTTRVSQRSRETQTERPYKA